MTELVQFAQELCVYQIEPMTNQPLFELRSEYVERCWLPVLGPSCIVMLRLFGELFEQTPQFPVRRRPLGAMLGLGDGRGINSPLNRTLNRLVQFHAAGTDDDADVLAVYRALGLVPAHLLDRLPPPVLAQHVRTRAQVLGVA